MAQHQNSPGGAPGNPPTITGPKRRLTEAAIARIKPPASGRLQIPDGHLTGLWLRVTDRGVKSWSVLYRANGGPVRRLTLGRWPAVGVSTARSLARDALLTAAKGEDPAAIRRADREQSSDRFDAVAAEFVERRCRRRGLRTTGEIEAMVRKYLLPAWSGRRIGSIGKADVLKVIDGISDASHGRQANKVLQLIRRMFSWAEKRALLDRNVAAAIEKPHAERSRDRVLDDRELAAVWRAAGQIGWPWLPFVRLLILLGQRRNEVASMRWQDVDLEAAVWRMPSELTKMGRARELPLPAAAVELLAALPRIGGSPLVLPANRAGSSRPISGWSKMKRRLDAAAAIEPWRLHDLRRSFATGMQRLGVRLEVTEQLLGHVSRSRAGVVGIYQRHDFAAEQRIALEKWADHIRRITTSAGEGAKVVRIA